MDNGLEKSRGLGKVTIIISMLIFICLAGCSKQFARIEENQAQLQTMIQANSENLAMMKQYIEQNQNELVEKIAQNQLETESIAQDVSLLSETQEKLHKSSQNNINELAVHLNHVSSNQEELKAGLVVSHNETAQVANNLGLMQQSQSELYKTVKNNNNTLQESIASLQKGQVNLVAKIEDSKNQTLKVSSEVASLGKESAKNYESSQNSIKQLVGQLNHVSDNQDILKKKQIELYNTVQSNNNEFSAKVASIESNQDELQTGLEKIQYDTDFVAKDIQTLEQGQINLHEAVNNYNQKMSERVELIELNKQQWQTSIQQMQKSVQQVAGNVKTFEQSLSKLEEILQGKIGDLVTASSTNSKDQSKFQEKMKNDLLSLVDSVNVIKKSQSQLQQKIDDVQNKTENIAIEFPIAIEKLRNELIVEETEVYSSDN